VYQSNETGRSEIYVESFPKSGERVQVSADGGTEPLWAKNGEIFYRHDDEVRVIAPRRAGRPEFEAPRPLFTFPIASGGNQTFDVTRDGARAPRGDHSRREPPAANRDRDRLDERAKAPRATGWAMTASSPVEVAARILRGTLLQRGITLARDA
jgi:hypothetical protein